MTATDTERLLRDVHPAEVYWPARSGKPIAGRLFVTTRRLILWVEHDGGMVHVESALTGEAPDAERGSLFGQLHLVTSDGEVHVSRGSGCGCGSPLKALSPPASW